SPRTRTPHNPQYSPQPSEGLGTPMPSTPALPQPLRTSHWPADTSTPLARTTVGELLRRVASEVPDRVALVDVHPGPAPAAAGPTPNSSPKPRRPPPPCSPASPPASDWPSGRPTAPNGW